MKGTALTYFTGILLSLAAGINAYAYADNGDPMNAAIVVTLLGVLIMQAGRMSRVTD